MAEIFNLREQAKQWLSHMFVPKEISPEGFINTGVGQRLIEGMMYSHPVMPFALTSLDKLLKTNAGKQIQTMLDATGPMGGGLDDIVIAAAKTAPAALGAVAPLVGNLGRLKPRGVPARPSEYFHSNLAEAVDKAWLVQGAPGDMLSIKQVKSWLNKLPGMGVKKEEIKHFDLAAKLNELEKGKSSTTVDFGDADILRGLIENFGETEKIKTKVTPGTSKISKQDLADIIDRKMPELNIDNGSAMGDPRGKYKEYTIPEGNNYQNHIFQPEGSVINDGYDYIKNPMADPNHSGGVHWENPNVLQHVRTTDRVLPDGRKALYAEEIQSDWQQQHPETYPLTQSYEDLAHKYLYRKAADEGYDSVAWAPGSVHIDRWNGSKEPAKPITNIGELDVHHPELWKQYSDEVTRYELEKYPVDMPNYASKDWQDAIKPIQNKYIGMAEDMGLTVPPVDRRFSGFETFYNKRMVDSATGMLKRMGGGEVSNTNLENLTSTSYKNVDIYTLPGTHPAVQEAEVYREHLENQIEKGDTDVNDNYVNLITNKYKELQLKLNAGIYDIKNGNEPIEHTLKNYERRYNPDAGFVQPSPNKSFKYDIKPEDKAHRGAQGWEAPMAGKTVPLWMLLSGMAFDQLRGDKK